MLSFLDRDRSVARPGYNRWLAPPAALSIHLAIGQVYAFSIFKNPLLAQHAINGSTWNLKEIGYVFSIAIAVLGLSAAIFGRWVERVGPRKAMFAAAAGFGSGFLVAAAGVATHTLALVYLGNGGIGGVGLGLGYISPVSTLIKWFPDRPGLATGLAIMGFGGGGMIGSPLGTRLMMFYRGAAHPIAATWVTMGLLYFTFMMFGVFTVRVPRLGWTPDGWIPKATPAALVSAHNVEVDIAVRTPQFWLLWVILCMNVTAGIGILEQASPMIQDLFHGRVTAVTAAGFVGVLSLFNMGGRFFWASLSDVVGRRTTYAIFFLAGFLLYGALPLTASAHTRSIPLFALTAGILLSMYGGGFATIPAYLKDLFGGYHVSAIHGRLLTAWSTAGILGPLLVNGVLDHYVADHLPRAQAYPVILRIMAGLMLVGLAANLLVRPVASRCWRENANSETVGA